MKETLDYCIKKITLNDPFNYVDIGALGGIHRKWNQALSVMKIIACDPDERATFKYNHSIHCYPYVLHRTSEDVVFYVTKGVGLSSIYQPNALLLTEFGNAERFKIQKEIIVRSSKVLTLDSLLEKEGIAGVDMIKADTQGSELSILQGSNRIALPTAFAVQVEVEFIPLYQKQPLFGEVNSFMSKEGFELIDLRRFYWKRKDYYNYRGKGKLVHGDALYFKNLTHLRKEVEATQVPARRAAKLWKAALVSLIYKTYDYAIAIAQIGRDCGAFSKAEHDQFSALVYKNSQPGFFVRIPGYSRAYNAIHAMLEKFRPMSYLGWADSDRDIANVRDI